MKLLVVEDDKRMADYLQKGLVEEGYVVERQAGVRTGGQRDLRSYP
jgi:DNA-binding response OmpR family regulator